MSLMIGLLAASFILGIALLAWGVYLLFKRPRLDAAGFYADYPQARVGIGRQVLRAAVADSVATRTQGLSGCPKMTAGQAMLFVFPAAARYSFWMKDMLFPLDMIWVRNGRIVDISADVPVPQPGASVLRLPRAKPAAPADSLIEVKAGLAAKHGWKAGDAVQVTREDTKKTKKNKL